MNNQIDLYFLRNKIETNNNQIKIYILHIYNT